MTRASDEVEPGSPSQATPGRRTRLWRAAPLGVALVCLLVSAWSVRDLGLTTDEPRYINNSQRLQAWFGDLFNQGPAAAFAEDRLAEGWYWARPESKNLPLVSLVAQDRFQPAWSQRSCSVAACCQLASSRVTRRG